MLGRAVSEIAGGAERLQVAQIVRSARQNRTDVVDMVGARAVSLEGNPSRRGPRFERGTDHSRDALVQPATEPRNGDRARVPRPRPDKEAVRLLAPLVRTREPPLPCLPRARRALPRRGSVTACGNLDGRTSGHAASASATHP